ncbi:hypothetical protein [Polynucleobacter sp.]|uniref:hypothetical protein n=1 Tax=Polynucleobacter sp. TaxID=2029855 RepID=UPI003F69FFEA
MKRVLCTRPNASSLISGVLFSRQDDGSSLSELIDDETAEMFLSIDGYSLHEEVAAVVKSKAQIAEELQALADAAKKEAEEEAKAAGLVEKPKAKASTKAAPKVVAPPVDVPAVVVAPVEPVAPVEVKAQEAVAPVVVPPVAEDGEVF